MVSTDGGQLGVRLAHEGLQFLFEQLVSGLGRSRLNRCLLRTVLVERAVAFPTGCCVVILTAEIIILAVEIIFTARCVLSLGLGLQTLDGQIDLAIFIADDHDLHFSYVI